MRILLGLCVLLLLGACNRVVGTEPMFVADTGADTTRLREGVWLTDRSIDFTSDDFVISSFLENASDQGADCGLDVNRPAQGWFPCSWALIAPSVFRAWKVEISRKDIDELADRGRPTRWRGQWRELPYVLADGEPLILQVAVPAEALGDFVSAGPDSPRLYFAYFGAEATRRSVDGSIEALELWPVVCGPPPPAEAARGGWPSSGTLEPFPGLQMEGETCTADSVEALRGAALASRPYGPTKASARWIEGAKP